MTYAISDTSHSFIRMARLIGTQDNQVSINSIDISPSSINTKTLSLVNNFFVDCNHLIHLTLLHTLDWPK